jgi:hypothetical protein
MPFGATSRCVSGCELAQDFGTRWSHDVCALRTMTDEDRNRGPEGTVGAEGEPTVVCGGACEASYSQSDQRHISLVLGSC